MSFLKFLISKKFFIHLGIAIGILIIAFFILKSRIQKYTLHDETLIVPDLSLMSVQEVEEVCSRNGFLFEIVDSSYEAKAPLFVILDQKPKPGMVVKPGRTLRLTISTDTPPKVKIPSRLINQSSSLDIALELMKDRGFQIDSVEYVPHEWQNIVLAVKKDGRKLEEGTYLKKGSKLVLVVGDGLSNEPTKVPYLIGNEFGTAVFILSGYGLNFGGPIPEDGINIEDTMNAIIYDQKPLPREDFKIAKGNSIDVWITTKERYEEMNIKHQKPEADSLNLEIDE